MLKRPTHLDRRLSRRISPKMFQSSRYHHIFRLVTEYSIDNICSILMRGIYLLSYPRFSIPMLRCFPANIDHCLPSVGNATDDDRQLFLSASQYPGGSLHTKREPGKYSACWRASIDTSCHWHYLTRKGRKNKDKKTDRDPQEARNLDLPLPPPRTVSSVGYKSKRGMTMNLFPIRPSRLAW